MIKSKSFEDGESGFVDTGGDYHEWKKGRDKYWEKSRGDGGNLLPLLVLGILFVIPSVISALLSALLLILFAKIILPSKPTIPYKNAFNAAFWTALIYLIVAFVLALLLPWVFPSLMGSTEEFHLLAYRKYFYFFEYHEISTKSLLIFHTLCILISALILRSRLKSGFPGFIGYAKAILIHALAILPILIFIMYVADIFVVQPLFVKPTLRY